MKSLQKEVSEKYDLVGVPIGTRQFNGFGTIDLTEVNLARADALAAREFPHFKLKQPVKPVAPKAAAGTIPASVPDAEKS